MIPMAVSAYRKARSGDRKKSISSGSPRPRWLPRVKVVSYGETTDLRIVRVEIDNFRGIKRLDWQPRPGINCLIGSGDSGKTTILDAIELVFASRNGVMFDDADFYDVDPKKNPISITVTLADIPSEFLRNDR